MPDREIVESIYWTVSPKFDGTILELIPVVDELAAWVDGGNREIRLNALNAAIERTDYLDTAAELLEDATVYSEWVSKLPAYYDDSADRGPA